MDDSSVELLARWQNGEQAAAEEIFARYLDRLIGLARSRLSSRLQRRVDPEDVVQSAYRSFFRHALEDRYVLERSGDLWRLLAAITINKLRKQVEFHRAGKRDVNSEGSAIHVRDSSGNESKVPVEMMSREPTPDDAVAIVEELEDVMRKLEPMYRQILELRLQGESVETIAGEVERTERTVRRVLERIRTDLETRLFGVTSP